MSNILKFRRDPKWMRELKRKARAPKPPPRGGGTFWKRALRAIGRWRLAILIAIMLIVGADSYRGGAAAHWNILPWTPEPTATDAEAAWFQICKGAIRYTCVIDGDTIWYRGEKIRVLGIDAPEVSSPGCPREEELGERATYALRDILNEGPFTLSRDGFEPNRDIYDRLLRRVTREGEPIAERLIWQGLAVRYRAAGPGWCD
ncbi:hypothetical protein CP97_00905 [Aurantiacibacter atlanticus]|uniref:TNase-like domain-containing protein n=1 Tax=Aurantiacibacter atlanticus TaxID=1648404 RepID=A0A0H4VJG2_9SPHN|nr:hypothetical protein CP97_00905 [Aurantiacibacter atlanticus]